MIRRLLLLLTVVAVCPFAFAAKDHAAAQQLLAGATQQIGLLEDSPQPFEMDVDFTAVLDMPLRGHLQLRWEAKDRWWMKLTVGPYEEIKLKIGEKSYTLRNGQFTPTQIREFFNLLHVGSDYGQMTVKKEKQRVENGITLDCMEARRPDPRFVPSEICVNSATREIVSDTRDYHENQLRRAQFSEFEDFAGHRYPRRLDLLENGKPLVTANVMELKAAPPLDAQMAVPPEGAIERRECENEKPPESIHPRELHLENVEKGGSDLIQVTVGADGKVSAMHVIKSGGPQMDRAVMDSIKDMRFKPAMCGADPVEADISIGAAKTY